MQNELGSCLFLAFKAPCCLRTLTLGWHYNGKGDQQQAEIASATPAAREPAPDRKGRHDPVLDPRSHSRHSVRVTSSGGNTPGLGPGSRETARTRQRAPQDRRLRVASGWPVSGHSRTLPVREPRPRRQHRPTGRRI